MKAEVILLFLIPTLFLNNGCALIFIPGGKGGELGVVLIFLIGLGITAWGAKIVKNDDGFVSFLGKLLRAFGFIMALTG